MYNKKWYSVPFTGDASALFYNKDLFKKAGLDPNKGPTTYAEVINAAKKITALGGGNKGFYFSGACAGCQVFTFAPAIWASGGDMFGPIGEPKFNDPKVAAGLRYYNTMWKNGYVPEGAKTDDGKNFASMFYSGKVGMQVSGSFMIPELVNNHKDINFEYFEDRSAKNIIQ
jgi:multiple sugar transport system substrate-binding protein